MFDIRATKANKFHRKRKAVKFKDITCDHMISLKPFF